MVSQSDPARSRFPDLTRRFPMNSGRSRFFVTSGRIGDDKRGISPAGFPFFGPEKLGLRPRNRQFQGNGIPLIITCLSFIIACVYIQEKTEPLEVKGLRASGFHGMMRLRERGNCMDCSWGFINS